MFFLVYCLCFHSLFLLPRRCYVRELLDGYFPFICLGFVGIFCYIVEFLMALQSLLLSGGPPGRSLVFSYPA